jgi:hypothetical protein
LFVVSPAKSCVYSSKFLASRIHKLEFKFSWMETWMQNLYRVYRASVYTVPTELKEIFTKTFSVSGYEPIMIEECNHYNKNMFEHY